MHRTSTAVNVMKTKVASRATTKGKMKIVAGKEASKMKKVRAWGLQAAH